MPSADLGVVAADVVAVPAQHVELVLDVGRRGGEEVARVAVLRDQAQGLAFAAAADEHRRPGDRLRRAERLGELVVLALERPVVVRVPHLRADLQRLLEALEPLGERRERDAEARGARARTRPRRCPARPAPGEHVERGDGLGEQAGVAVGDARDQQAEVDRGRVGGQVAERRVALEHRGLRRAGRSARSGRSGP